MKGERYIRSIIPPVFFTIAGISQMKEPAALHDGSQRSQCRRYTARRIDGGCTLIQLSAAGCVSPGKAKPNSYGFNLNGNLARPDKSAGFCATEAAKTDVQPHRASEAVIEIGTGARP